MKPLSEKTASLLRLAGWSEQRRVDTKEWEEFLISQGYPVHPVIMDFLSRYGRLRVFFPDVYGKPKGNMFFIDPRKALASPEEAAELSERAGTSLCPIGETGKGYFTLLMDANGELYSTSDGSLERYVNPGIDPIELIPGYLTDQIVIP